MKKFLLWAVVLLPMLTGCGPIGAKAASLSAIYAAAAILSLLLLFGCIYVVKNKDKWFLLLFTSIFVVNTGYFMLSVSGDLDQALLANRVAYLGSVFLPISMGMIICKVCKISLSKWVPGILLLIGAVMFFIAASPGWLDIYYKEVTFQKLNGVTVLQKVYGPCHILYLIYLLSGFAAMIVTIFYAIAKKKLDSAAYAVLLLVAVFVNIGVWLTEQLVQIDFEVLSVSYIISECFLLGLYALMEENQRRQEELAALLLTQKSAPTPSAADAPDPAELELFRTGLTELTPKEQLLYDCYLSGMSTAEIMENLQIKENTLKYHNKNLYSKLGVRSRKQMLRVAAALHRDQPV